MSDVIDSGVVPLDSSSPQQHKDPVSVPVERSTAKGSLSGSHSVWRRRIRATLPLLLVKKFDRKQSAGKVDIEHIEEEDSEFEEVCTPVTQPTPMDTSEAQPAVSCRPLLEEQQHVSLAAVPRYRIHTSPQSPIPTPTPPSPPSAPSPPSPLEPPSDCSVISLDESPKKKLTLTQKERQKLLDWDVVTPGTFSLMAPAADRTVQKDVKPEAQPQPPPSPQAKNITEPESSPAPAEEPSSYMSGLQFWANTFRRVGTDTAILRGSRKPKPRPLSDGSISLSTLFGRTQTQTQTQGSSEPPDQPRPGAVGEGAQSPQTRGSSELTTMLQQVALSRKDSANAKDDLASLPPKKLNFFSSLRVKRREGADSQEKDIWNILSKFRSKASTQTAQRLEGSSSSSDDEGEGHRDPVCDPTRQKGSSAERQRRKQEKVLIQQAKREQLKRLHRAQAIQRQLEEVEEQQRALEEKGVVLEKLLRGEMEDDPEEESQLLQTWFRLVVEKNKLARYEAELVIFAQELELEDRQSQLQQDLRRRMAISDRRKIPSERREEQRLLAEVMRVVDERDRLVSLLEEQRLMERAEDHDLETMVLSKGYQLHWT